MKKLKIIEIMEGKTTIVDWKETAIHIQPIIDTKGNFGLRIYYLGEAD